MLDGRVTLVFVISVILVHHVWSDNAVDYCSKELCKFPWTKDEPKHIACDSPEGFGPKCGANAGLAVVTPELKAALVKKVNEYRNNVAAGGTVIAGGGWKFRPAIRMAYMDWDDELAHIAGLASKTCTQMNDDTCFNTNSYKSTAAASHIIGTTVSPSGVNASQHILNAIDNFYKQHDKLWLEKVDEYPKADQAREFREFALLIADHNTKFGCGCTYADSTPGWINFYVTCVFSTKNVDPSPVYKTGETSASGCSKKHETFQNLCDTSEDIDPNFGFKGLQKAWEAEEAKWHTPESLAEYLKTVSSRKHLCDPELCGPSLEYDDLQPSRCNITMALGPACIKPRVYKMPKESQQKVLDAFNAIRNEAAGGELIGADGVKLPKAKRMPYLQWDDELAELALLPLLECPKRIPNICGNTYKYISTDYIESYWPSNSKYEPEQIMAGIYMDWWKDQRKAIKPEYIEKYPNTHISFPFKTLSLIIADHATKVGCGYLVNREKLDVNGYYFNCIFSTQKIEGFPIYNVSDQTASGCEKTHPKFTKLCDESEPVEPNLMSNIIKERLAKERYDTQASNELIKRIFQSENYCDKNLCRGESNPHHVACPKILSFGTKCSKNAQLLKFTPEFKQRIVDRHNYYRNLTAGGHSVGENGVLLPKAVRMGYMQWDDELANVATMNAKDCVFKHDSCRNTKKFTLAGQNLYMISGVTYPDTQIEAGVDSWYSETKFTSPEQIAKYPVVSPPKDRTIGHFTVMVNEKSIRVGCAMSLFAHNLHNNNYLVCNYAFTNMQAHHVYKSGDVPASECTKRDEKYINLCHPEENIDPNNVYDLAPSLKTFLEKKPNLGVLTPKKKKNDTTIQDILKPIVERNYCDPLLCRPGEVHIGCNKTAEMGPNCGNDRKIVLMTPANIELIVDLHNSLRNKTAGGHVRGAQSSFLPKAVRMAYMQWDQELADLALLNLQNCKSSHDECHNTKNFYMSGQNLFGASESPASTSNTEFLKIGVKGWFQEHEYVLPKFLATLTSESVPPGLNTGHFTVMVNEKATRVGCAAVTHYSDKFTHFKLTCNYAVTNMLNEPVYRAGNVSGSECKSLHPVYSNLCEASEDINPNDGYSPLGEKPKAPSFNFEELMNRTGLPFDGASVPGTFNVTAISGPSMTDMLSALNQSQPTTVVFHGPMSVEDMLKMFAQQEKDSGSEPTLTASNNTSHQIFKTLDLDKPEVQGRFGSGIDSNTIEEVTSKPTYTTSTPVVPETTIGNAIEEQENTTISPTLDEPIATAIPTLAVEPKVIASTDKPETTDTKNTSKAFDETIVTTLPTVVDEPKDTTTSPEEGKTAVPTELPEITTVPAIIEVTEATTHSGIANETKPTTDVPIPPAGSSQVAPEEKHESTLIKPNGTIIIQETRVFSTPNIGPFGQPAEGIFGGGFPGFGERSSFETHVVRGETVVHNTVTGSFSGGFPGFGAGGFGMPGFEHVLTSHNQTQPDATTGPSSSTFSVFSRSGFGMPGLEHFDVQARPAPAQEDKERIPNLEHFDVQPMPAPSYEVSSAPVNDHSIFRRVGFGMPGLEHFDVQARPAPPQEDKERIPNLEHFDVQPMPAPSYEVSSPPVNDHSIFRRVGFGMPGLEHFDVQARPAPPQEDKERIPNLEHFDVQPMPAPSYEVSSPPVNDHSIFRRVGFGMPGLEHFDVQARPAPPQEDKERIPNLEHFDVQPMPAPSYEVSSPPVNDHSIFRRVGFGMPGFEHVVIRQETSQPQYIPSPNTNTVYTRGGFSMPGFEHFNVPQSPAPTQEGMSPPPNMFSGGAFGMPSVQNVVITQDGGNINPFLVQKAPGNMPPQIQSSQIFVQRTFGSQTGNPYGGMFGQASPSPTGGWSQSYSIPYSQTSQNLQ